MPRPMLHNNTQQAQLSRLSLTPPRVRTSDPKQKMRLDRLLREPRSREYVALLKKLDAGGHVMNRQACQDIVDRIKAELPEVELEGLLIGIVSRCYLGDDYEVHTLDLSGSIIEHYHRGQTLPNGMEKARALALHGSYAFIEVYTDCCRAISDDGSVSVV